jgi:uncharacterized membrane protein YfcA
MSLVNLIGIGAVLILGSVLQGAVGFGLGLFAIPILVWAGVRLSEAVAIVSVAIFIQVLAGTYELRSEVRWRQVLPATLIRYLTIPLGVMLLLAIDALDRAQAKQILGVLLLLVLLVQLFWKVEPREHLHQGWMALAFSFSGVMHGMAAMGGPPAVLWVMAHRWTNRQTRAFLQALFLLAAPFQIALLYLFSKGEISGALLTGLAFAPLVVLGSTLGVRLGNAIPKQRLRQIAYGFLLVTALASVMAPVLA